MQKNYLRQFLWLILLGVSFTLSYGQSGSIGGTVTDASNQPIPFVSISISSTTQGSVADMDGNYLIKQVKPGTYNVVASFIGYTSVTQQVSISEGKQTKLNFTLKEDVILLNQAVAIGYGTTEKKDLTGSVASVNAKEFNKGIIATPEQLIQGKTAGVKITTNGGAPGSGSRIRIRGGTSLNASNDPLIVVDGVPLDNNGISGAPNGLSLINPNDIENMTVLKDASAAAIYGARAANGVIIITTKKGSASSFHVDFNTNFAISTVADYTDVLSADEFRNVVMANGTNTQKGLLGKSVTNWQSEIYRNALTSDNNISFTGGIKGLPYRLSFGLLSNAGTLQYSQMDRKSVGINLNPSFFDNSLTLEVNAKYSTTYNFFPDQGAIGSAVGFDPTQNIYSDTTAYGGYFEWLDNSKKPIVVAARNPMGLLNLRDDKGFVNRFIGNAGLDYKFKFLPGLRAHVNVGGDISRSHGSTFTSAAAASAYTTKGSQTQYEQSKDNKLFDFYLNYNKEFNPNNRLDLTAGYSYQYWSSESPAFYSRNAAGDTLPGIPVPSFTENALISVYGRINYTLFKRFLFTATLRDDASSRFDKDLRHGLFPSAAFAWRISDETFLQDVSWLSILKLRLGYGVTGQQDINNDYPYIANYSQGNNTAQYQFGSQYYYVLRPDAYDKFIKWEETTTTNAGIDFGFFNGRINGAVDVYRKETKDLIVNAAPAAGTNFGNSVLTNVGSLENEGLEVTLNFIPVATDKITWEIGTNFSTNNGKITKITGASSESEVGIKVGGIQGGINNTIQVHTVGYAPNTFYVYEQIYDANGKPKEGQYIDQNNDGKINENDLVRKHRPDAKYLVGLNTNVTYKNWSLGASLRGEFGHYIYYNVASIRGNLAGMGGSVKALSNLSTDYLNTGFKKEQYFSDYYLRSADFIKLDYVSLAYNFKNLIKDKYNMVASFNVQNVFIISDYAGLDPEVGGGIDQNIYPRPRIYSINLNFQF
ncbi:MAG: SusC/RagA family TonB-linked outer membrane protein [Bacteroidia bacterium]|nr:SusC/RagA family TonB-linked outer membrane protein [Bacteroidia bacterium]